MLNPNVRQAMFPYGMAKNPDGSWSFFNRSYKAVGTITTEWSEWNTPEHRMMLTGLGPAVRKKLDIHGVGPDDRIYFYDDGSVPERNAANMTAYLERLKILMGLKAKR